MTERQVRTVLVPYYLTHQSVYRTRIQVLLPYNPMKYCHGSTHAEGKWVPITPLPRPPCCPSNVRSNSPFCTSTRRLPSGGSWAPRGLEGKGCAVGHCTGFKERFTWRPKMCNLEEWNPHEFCSVLAGQRLLFIGDSTMDQAAYAVHSLLKWQCRESSSSRCCAEQIMYASSDTLVRRRFGANNRGRIWYEWVKLLKPNIVIFGTGAHVYGEGNFTSVLESVAKQSLAFPNVRFIWRTSMPGGCGVSPLSQAPNISFWNSYQGVFHNWPFFPTWDSIARRFWATRNVSVFDLTPLYRRVDAHVGGTKANLGGDCLHFCDAALRLIPTLLFHLLRHEWGPSSGTLLAS